MALVNFYKNETQLQKQQMAFFENLQAKVKMRKEADANKTKDQVPNIKCPPPAKKRERASHHKIQMGWLHSENGQVKQHRTKQGGRE